MAKTSSPRRARTNSSPSAWPDIMLPSPRSRIGNPFLKSGLFVPGVSAMIASRAGFDTGVDANCHRSDGSVHTTREPREFLKHHGCFKFLRANRAHSNLAHLPNPDKLPFTRRRWEISGEAQTKIIGFNFHLRLDRARAGIPISRTSRASAALYSSGCMVRAQITVANAVAQAMLASFKRNERRRTKHEYDIFY